MDSDSEVERAMRGKDRPPSSYGSMRSDDEEELEFESNSPGAFNEPIAPAGLQLIRSTYPETVHTETTEQTKQCDAFIIHTRFEEEAQVEEAEEQEEEECMSGVNSPVPPPPVEDGDQMESAEARLERLHPELAMPHVFKNINNVLSRLSDEDVTHLKVCLCREEKRFDLRELLHSDSLDLVDKMIEVLGYDHALKLSIEGLESIKKTTEAQNLKDNCRRVMLRYQLRQHILRKFRVLYEGVPRPGKQQLLDTVYVQPQISRRQGDGVDPAPGGGTADGGDGGGGFVDVRDLLRLPKASGEPARTLLTTGVPGIGLSVVAAKFSMDWAEGAGNQVKHPRAKDIQFVILLSFESLWSLQNFQLPPSKKMSLMEVITHYYQGFGDAKYLEDRDCKFLILMDSFDCYLDTLDWKKTRVVSDSHVAAHLDVLIVNLIRGNLLPSARIWILGRQAAVSNIPPELIDVVTDVEGFSDQMKDEYLRRRFQDAQLAERVVSHYKRAPVLGTLCRQPFVCWLAATAFQRCFRYHGYGTRPPRLTPFYIQVMVIQTNRMLQRYRGQSENHLKWSTDDVKTLLHLGKLALAMVEKQVWWFSGQDLKDHGLGARETTVFSGLCAELPSPDTPRRKQFRFLHESFQEFMAAVYLFATFHREGRVALKEPGGGPHPLRLPKLPRAAESSRSAEDLLRAALQRAAGSPHADAVLRFLCGVMSRGNHTDMLRGKLALHSQQAAPLEGARRLLEQEVERAAAHRRDHLRECLRELVQEDE